MRDQFLMLSPNLSVSSHPLCRRHIENSVVQVAWIKADAKAILAIHEHVITNNGRLSVTHNDYNTWTLNIKSVKMEDRGQYMCQVNTGSLSPLNSFLQLFSDKILIKFEIIYSDPMKMQTAFLEVVIPPDIIYEEVKLNFLFTRRRFPDNVEKKI